MRPIALSSLADKILALYAPPMAAAATLRQMRQILREIGEVPGIKRSSDLDEQAIAKWIAIHALGDRPRSPARTESLLRCLRVICNYAIFKHWLADSPFHFKPLKRWVRADAGPARRVSPPRRKTAEEIGRLLHLLDGEASEGTWRAGRLQALVYVYVFTGLRRDEALHMLAKNVDLGRLTLKIEPVGNWRPKTVRSARTLPLADPLAEVLARWAPRCGSEWLFPGKRLKSPWIGATGYKPIDAIRGAAERAGIGQIWIKTFRVGVGTDGKQVLSGLEMQTILGHADAETQRWYDEEQVDSMRPAMKRLAALYGYGT